VIHTLYLVGTPIGNLEDISPRALQVLGAVGLIASENPARTQRLLARYDIDTPMIRFTDAYNRKKETRMQAVLDALERADVALVSEAGMPLLADPGYELVQAVLAGGGPIEAVPGPSAASAALSMSGLPLSPATFVGFAPRRSSARRELFRSYAGQGRTLVVYESPNRLLETLVDARAELGNRPVSLSCELTKLYEETWRGSLEEAIDHVRASTARGEYVIVIGPEDAQYDQDR